MVVAAKLAILLGRSGLRPSPVSRRGAAIARDRALGLIPSGVRGLTASQAASPKVQSDRALARQSGAIRTGSLPVGRRHADRSLGSPGRSARQIRRAAAKAPVCLGVFGALAGAGLDSHTQARSASRLAAQILGVTPADRASEPIRPQDVTGRPTPTPRAGAILGHRSQAYGPRRQGGAYPDRGAIRQSFGGSPTRETPKPGSVTAWERLASGRGARRMASPRCHQAPRSHGIPVPAIPATVRSGVWAMPARRSVQDAGVCTVRGDYVTGVTPVRWDVSETSHPPRVRRRSR